jgi:hypothetical protein
MRSSAQPNYNDLDGDDIFEKPAAPRNVRRATANDYQQAYREVESGYDDEAPRSRVPWILAGLLFLVLATAGSIWAYSSYVRPQVAATTDQAVPVVGAPEAPTKVTSDSTTETPATAPGEVLQPTRKQIYDRIVGDREVLGGNLTPTEETPVQPVTNQPALAPTGQPTPAVGTGTDGTPLPLPPPPGATGDGTQGSIEVVPNGDQQVAIATPAAGASQAADLQLDTPVATAQSVTPVAGAPIGSLPLPPAPTQAAPTQVASTSQTESVEDSSAQVSNSQVTSTSEDTPSQDDTTLTTPVPKKVVTARTAAAKKAAIAKTDKSLGAKPRVLVAPSRKAAAARRSNTVDQGDIIDVATNGTNSFYNDAPIGQVQTNAPTSSVAEAQPKKRRTLSDLFKSNNRADTTGSTNRTPQAEAAPADQTPRRVATVTQPPAAQQNSATGAYVAQLASFKSRAEATREYNRMVSKHGAVISRHAPIVSEAQVAGTTRYRLSIGPMPTSGDASSLCRSLVAAGERDCLVRRQ